MKVIIPAAGAGTRLRPHTHTIPKALVQVAGKPILGHILDRISTFDVTELIIIIGYMGDKIKNYLDVHYNFKTTYVEQEKRLGLGYAINLARDYLDDEPTLITLDDTILEMDMAAMVKGAYSSIGAKEVEDASHFGIIELENGFIKRLIEKPENPPSNLAIVGVYYIQNTPLLFECLQEIIDKKIRTQNEYQLTDALQLMLEKGEKIISVPVDNWYDCGKPESLLNTNRYLLQKQWASLKTHKNYNLPNSIVIPPVFIADTVEIQNSVIGPFVSVADGSKVNQSIIKDTIINENATVENVLLNQSLIGENAIVSGRYSCLNVGDSSQIKLL
jgi:glucose-1-phosphate thymidylyltransferase